MIKSKDIFINCKRKKVFGAVLLGFAIVSLFSLVIQSDKSKIYTITSDGIVIEGKNLEGYSLDIIRYDNQSDIYKNVAKRLHFDPVQLDNLEVMDIDLKDKDGKTVMDDIDVKVKIELGEDIKNAKGNYILLDKDFIANKLAVFNDKTVEYSSKQLGRIIIYKTENKNFYNSLSSNKQDGSQLEEIEKTSINEVKIMPINDQKYTGKAIQPTVTVMHGSKALKKDVDYIISYSNNTLVGYGEVIIQGKGDYEGSSNVTFKIIENSTQSDKGSNNQGNSEVKKTPIKYAKISSLKDQKYTGNAIEPSILVTLDKKTLIKDVDYRVTYSNNTKTGTAKVMVAGIGKYEGSLSSTFKIVEEKKDEYKIITLNTLTSHHGFKGYYTKDDNIVNVDKEKLGLSCDERISLYFIEYYDVETKESILFACPYVQETVFMNQVDKAGGWDSVPVKVIK